MGQSSILRNLELDFTKTDGSAYDTIILAGENGTGKTTILETISTFLNLGSIQPFQYIKYTIDNIPYVISAISEHDSAYGFHMRKNESDNTEKQIRSNKSNNRDSIEQDQSDIRYYGCIYSKARSGFNTKKVTTTTMQHLDTTKHEDDSNEDFTVIKQLIVDIDSQDNSEWMNICRSGIEKSFLEFQQSSKIYKFENAFNDFFDNLKWKKVDNNAKDEIKILFEKHGKEVSIDELSTGEKQIVFRGAHLLRNSNNINGGFVLIDEPELSMHPKWQEKILQYYRNLFTKNGKQTSQIIIATHSEYVQIIF